MKTKSSFDPKQATDLTPMDAADLAVVLGNQRTPASIAADVHRRPESLPPQSRLPGSNRNRWTWGTVKSWLENQEPLL